MKKLIYIFSFSLVFVFACSATKTEPVECAQMICTQEFRMVQVKFKDAAGNPVTVKDYSAINKRTGTSTVQNNEPVTVNNQGIYTVASDADVKKLSEAGDVITVSATHPTTNNKVTAEFVVNGGKCACHINKVSGPSEVIL
ncbi:hypothetical protein [Daejeonella sp.]|uniref:hypothetical protein n=1 Tax=Daejeonella sp. TaxID=2805397 RepID=UPI0030C4B91C